MLYNIIAITISLISLTCSVCALYAVYRVLGALGDREPQKVTRAQRKRIKKAQAKTSDETRRINALIDNIERYDGTGFGQKEIR